MGKRFENLRKHIEREYENRGFSEQRANNIAYATAAKVYKEKKGCINCRLGIPHGH